MPRPPDNAGTPLAKVGAGCGSFLLLVCTILILITSVPNPIALALSTIAAVMPAIFYSLLVLSIDRYEHEPWRTIVGAFGWGAIAAVVFSFIFNTLFQVAVGAAAGPEIGMLTAASLGAPVVEESFKGVALLGLLLMFRGEFDNVLDGLVYGALIGLGFAMTENILYFGRQYIAEGVPGLTELFIVRSVLGGFGHALFTATTGAAVGWTRSQYGRGGLRYVVPIVGWGLAVLQHFLWNTGAIAVSIVIGPNGPMFLGVLILVILFTVPALITLYAISRAVSTRECRIIHEQLAGEVKNGVISREEYELLSDDNARRKALRLALRRGGPSLWRAQRRFFQAAAELAFRKYHISRGEPLKGEQKDLHEDEYRAQLVAMRARLRAPDGDTPLEAAR